MLLVGSPGSLCTWTCGSRWSHLDIKLSPVDVTTVVQDRRRLQFKGWELGRWSPVLDEGLGEGSRHGVCADGQEGLGKAARGHHACLAGTPAQDVPEQGHKDVGKGAREWQN